MDPRLLHLLAHLLEQGAAVVQRGLELVAAAVAQPPQEPELLLGDAEVDLVVDRRHPVQERRAEHLAQSDRVVFARHGRQEAPVEVQALELDLAARGALDHQLVGPALDRLHVEGRHHLGQVGHLRLGQHGAGKHGLREQPSLLPLVGIAGGAPKALGELPGDPVGPAGTERHRPAHRVDAADRLIDEVAIPGHRLHGLGPGPGLVAGAHLSRGPRRRRRPSQRLVEQLDEVVGGRLARIDQRRPLAHRVLGELGYALLGDADLRQAPR